MKKKLLALLCACAVLVLMPAPAYADMGPKPSVVVDFEGLEEAGGRYYATLLADFPTTGPFSALEGDPETQGLYQAGEENYDIFLKFARYEDAEGYYFLQYFQDCTETHRFNWSYFPPDTFKILLYFPETDSFVSSGEAYTRYAFSSYYTVDASGPNLMVRKSYNYTWEAAALVMRVVITLAIELGIAWLFKLREKAQRRYIVRVNLITQIALNVLLNVINYQSGMLAVLFLYFLLEFVVFLVEGILYAASLPKRSEQPVSKGRLWLYAWTANTASFIMGALLVLFSFA